MATLRDFLLANTTLPITGTYTYAEHFQSFVSNVTAEKGGDIFVTSSTTDVELVSKPVEIVIESHKQSTEVAQNVDSISVDSTSITQIVIDPDC